MEAGVGIYVDGATPSSDGFCVVSEIHRGGAVDRAGYEQKNGEILRVQVGDWLLRVNGISCKHMPRAEGKEVEFTPEINNTRDRSIGEGERERERERGRSPRQDI